MRFRFCGNGDCPDWVLAEINTLSRLSSLKLKSLATIVVQGLLDSSLEIVKAEKIFNDSRLDADVDLKACVACISYIISSTIRYNCDHAALFSELQQLGLPREHSLSLKKVVAEYAEALTTSFKSSSLCVNRLQDAVINCDSESQAVKLEITVNNSTETVHLLPHTVDLLLHDLKQVRSMAELVNS
ncbi:hypothetical protein FQA39_LY16400 [Lamprigera yunnana]|nr:hypothetical protein FQA39_LY16400 [Lamprigera yunnana]